MNVESREYCDQIEYSTMIDQVKFLSCGWALIFGISLITLMAFFL